MASKIRVDEIEAAQPNGDLTLSTPGGNLLFNVDIDVPTGRKIVGQEPASIYAPGMVIQVQTVRTDIQEHIPGNDTKLANLAITITPRTTTSLLICQWYISGEAHHDTVLRVMKNDAIPANGYNTVQGNVAWSGIVAWDYDQNESSTPAQVVVNYFDSPGVLTPIEYAPAIRDSSAGSDGIYLNRTVNSLGTNAYEATVSFGMIWEIAQ